MTRREDLTDLAKKMAEESRRESEWFLERARHYEAIGREIAQSEDPQLWERAYRALVSAWSDPDLATPVPGGAR